MREKPLCRGVFDSTAAAFGYDNGDRGTYELWLIGRYAKEEVKIKRLPTASGDATIGAQVSTYPSQPIADV